MNKAIRESLLDNNEAISSHLAKALYTGELMIVLGAGTSVNVGLPNWVDLINKCIEYAANRNKSISQTKLKRNCSLEQALRRANEIRSELGSPRELNAILREALYGGLKEKEGYDKLLKIDLLIALGSLLIGSRRGSVTDVVTYNYDDVLEWYLHLHGFVSQVIINPMTVYGNADVRIYHPHGFIPYNDQFKCLETQEIIFDKTSYDKRIGSDEHSPWRKNLELLLGTKQALFIGISDNDPTLGPLFASLSNYQQNRIASAFWMRTKKDKSTHMESLDNDRNIIPIYLDNHNDYPEFLLNISRIAAKNLTK